MSVLDGLGPAKPPADRIKLYTRSEDAGCCGVALDKALASGKEVAFWQCPTCGEEWRPEKVGAITHWTMRPGFFIGLGRQRPRK